MAHIEHNNKESATRHPAWFAVGASIARLANEVSGRYDLVGLASPSSGSGAPACYKPEISEIEVNTNIAFGAGVTPEMIGDLQLRATQYEFPKATGAVFHEAFHAKFSSWDLKTAFEALKSDEYQALVLLEEGRIEAQGILSDSRAQLFLRACALEIVIGDVSEDDGHSIESLTNLVGLVHGRIIAGVLDADELLEVTDYIESVLGIELVEKLSALLVQAQNHDNHRDATAMYPLAIEWARLVREVKAERGEEEEGAGTPEDGTPTSGSGDSDVLEMLKEIVEMLSEASEAVSISNSDDLQDQEQSEDWKEEVGHRESKAKEESKHRKTASEVFGRGTGEVTGTTSDSRLVEQRKPTSGERSSAVIIARLLEKAKYRERDVVETSSATPPGRLRTKALVQGKALEERGIRTPVEPWRKSVRKHTDDPTLTVGVMVDISGSMASAMNPMATTAWVMSEAVRRVQGRCAMVYFGNDVFPTLKAGQHLDDVSVFSASDGTEKFDKAFQAINGSLNLLDGQGARLLVVVSDGEFTGTETVACRKWLSRCEQAGVAVLWLPFNNGYSAQRLLNPVKVKPLVGKLDPVEAAAKIGEACAKALTAIGKRNS